MVLAFLAVVIQLDFRATATAPFMYSFRRKTMLKDAIIPDMPEEVEESMDLIFDGASEVVKKAMIDNVKELFGLKEHCSNLREAFQSARENSYLTSSEF